MFVSINKLGGHDGRGESRLAPTAQRAAEGVGLGAVRCGWSVRVRLQARVEQYLAERRQPGFKLRSMGHGLPSFARYVANADHDGPLTVDLMADWARQAKAGRGDRATLARRLKMLRPFTAWSRRFEPATAVPDEAVFGRVPGRMTPHV